jgi:Arc/MetJ-type ribon-helix-helix transcriptional regulator
MAEDKVEVRIGRDLYEKARKFIEETGGFESVDELVEFLLREVLEEEQEQPMSEEDEEKVKERLRSLGYI